MLFRSDPEKGPVYGDVGYIEKVVKVKNTGFSSAYIRTHIAIPTNLVGYLYLDMVKLEDTGWIYQGESVGEVVSADGKTSVKYTVFTYDFKNAVEGSRYTDDLLKGVYLASDVDLEEDVNGNLWFVKKTAGEITHRSDFMAHEKTASGYVSTTVNVLVASQAIQAQGFNEGATSALNTGFGTGTNPWQN